MKVSPPLGAGGVSVVWRTTLGRRVKPRNGGRGQRGGPGVGYDGGGGDVGGLAEVGVKVNDAG